MPRPRHQRGWLTKEGGLIYGNYRRYVTDPATGKQKKKHVVLVLGPISQMKKWEAQQKLEGIIAEDLGVRQIQQNRPDPETSFGWFVRHRYLPMREGRWHQATKEKPPSRSIVIGRSISRTARSGRSHNSIFRCT